MELPLALPRTRFHVLTQAFSFRVRCSTGAVWSPWSEWSAPVDTPPVAPDPIDPCTITFDPQHGTLRWDAPSVTGGASVTWYGVEVRCAGPPLPSLWTDGQPARVQRGRPPPTHPASDGCAWFVHGVLDVEARGEDHAAAAAEAADGVAKAEGEGVVGAGGQDGAVREGACVDAVFSGDGLYYAGTVVAVLDGGSRVEVEFAGYGNREVR